jgi:outer membrane protein assembly factor BamE (lipoprotein component of BamABCDE complex)
MWILPLVALVLIAPGIASGSECETQFAEGYSAAAFDRVAVGMTEADVRGLLRDALLADWVDAPERWLYGDDPLNGASVFFAGDAVAYSYDVANVSNGMSRSAVELVLGRPKKIEPAGRIGTLHYAAPGACDTFAARIVFFATDRRVMGRGAHDRAPRALFARAGERGPDVPAGTCTLFASERTDADFARVTPGMPLSDVTALLGESVGSTWTERAASGFEPATRTGILHFSEPGECETYAARVVTIGADQRVDATWAEDRAPSGVYRYAGDRAKPPADECTDFGGDFTEEAFALVVGGMTRLQVEALVGGAWREETEGRPETWWYGATTTVAFADGRALGAYGTDRVSAGMDRAAVEAALGKPGSITPDGATTRLHYARPKACAQFADRVVELGPDGRVLRRWSDDRAPAERPASSARD